MRDTPMSKATRAGYDRLISIAEVLLDVHKVVTSNALRTAVHNFRRWDHLVRRPLVASAYSLSRQQTQDLLQPVGMPATLIERAFDAFARRQQRSSSWSRVLGEAPNRRVDALELFSGLALTCRGTVKAKLEVLFFLFDSGETGVLTEDDLGAMISSCASILRQLGLSLPISSDQAAFAAGEPFGHQQSRTMGSTTAGDCSDSGVEPRADEIDQTEFLEWARRAELPARALELLALPHRISRTVDLISISARSLMRERYIPDSIATYSPAEILRTIGRELGSEHASNRPIGERRVPALRLVRTKRLLLLGRESTCGTRKFTVPPFLCRVCAHSATVMLEIGTGGTSTAEDSTWRVVISVEERRGPRFCSVDSQPIVLRYAEPGIILLSKLRAATDHRLKISWGTADNPKKLKGDVTVPVLPGGRHDTRGCTTLRYTTLPADSMMISASSESRINNTLSKQALRSERRRPVTAVRRCIEFVSVSGASFEKDACQSDEVHLLQPHPTSSSPGNPNRSSSVSVVICRGQRTSLGSTEKDRMFDQWLDAAAQSPAKATGSSHLTDVGMLIQSWPRHMPTRNDTLPLSSAAAGLEDVRSPSTPDVAPCCGEAISRNELAAREKHHNSPWAGEGHVESGGIEFMVHLKPDWRAVEVVRRCFQILKQCRLESPSVRECARRMVSTEIKTAIRSLLSKCVRLKRRTLRDRARRSCAHFILGELQHPWLGLGEDELLIHDEKHRAIVSWEIASAFRAYLMSDGADAGASSAEGEGMPPPRLSSTNSVRMAIGSGCFLIRPGQPQPLEKIDSSPPVSSRDNNEHSTGSASTPSSIVSVSMPISEKVTFREEDQPADNDSATTSTADDGAGPPTRSDFLPVDTARKEAAPTETPSTSQRVSVENGNPEAGIILAGSLTFPVIDDGPEFLPRKEEIKVESEEERPASQELGQPGDNSIVNGAAETMEADVIRDTLNATVGAGLTADNKLLIREDSNGSTKADHEEAPASQEEEAISAVNDGIPQIGADGAKTIVAGTEMEEVVEVSEPSAEAGDDEGGGVGATSVRNNLVSAAENDSGRGRTGAALDEPSGNPVLNALLLDMTMAAEGLVSASAARFSGEGDQKIPTKAGTPGCTAIIILDAPLITSDLHPLRVLRRKKDLTHFVSRTSSAIPRRESMDLAKTSRLEDAEYQGREAISDAFTAAASSRGRSSSEIDTTAALSGLAVLAEEVQREFADVRDTAAQSDTVFAAVTSSRDITSSDPDTITWLEAAAVLGSCDDADKRHGNDGGKDGANNSDEQHPAGLGDPIEALESLLSWIGEGTSSDCGRREVLLICCGGVDPGGGNTASGETRHGGSFGNRSGETCTTGGESGGGKRAETGRASARGRGGQDILLDAVRDGYDGEYNAAKRKVRETKRTTDVELVLPEGERGGATGGRHTADGGRGEQHQDEGLSSSGDDDEGDQPAGTIRQIILGGTVPIPMPPDQRGLSSPASNASGRPPSTQLHGRSDGVAKKLKVPAVVKNMRPAHSAGLPSSTHKSPPTSVEHVYLPPSEVLLRTRYAAPNEENFSRVAIRFPPLSVVPAAAELLPSMEKDERISDAVAEEVPVAARNDDTVFDDSVRVVVGPVIGRVGPTSATVLVEVDTVDPVDPVVAAADNLCATRRGRHTDARVSNGVGMQLTDTLTGQRREMTGGAWTRGQPGSGPRVFEFEGLTPGRRFTLRLFGVRQRDQIARTGGFCTPLEGEGPPAMWALSPLAAPVEALEEILADVQTARPTATSTLTVGPMLDASKVGRALYPLVLAENDKGPNTGGLSIGARALSAFRELYRHAWDEPRVRKLLANTSLTPSSAGAGDLLLPLLSNFPPGWLPLNATIAGRNPPSWRRGTRGMRRKETTKRRSRARGVRGGFRGCEREGRGGGIARALGAVAGAALQASKEYQEALFGGAAISGGNGGGYRVREGAAKGCGGPLPTFQRRGGVGVLNVSVASSQVDWALGRPGAGRRLLSREAWAWLEDFFRAPEIGSQEGPGINTLIVVTDSPLLWRSASSTSPAAIAAENRSHEASALRTTERGDEGLRHRVDGRRTRQESGGGGGGVRNFNRYRREGGAKKKAKHSPFSSESRWRSRAPSPSWSAHPREAAYLLSLLFSWAATTKDGDDSQRKTEAAAADVATQATKSNIAASTGGGLTLDPSPSLQKWTAHATAREGGESPSRSFSVACPATRVRMNIETYVKDSETGRVAVQWCLASNDGDEALIPMSGSISPRFSFTHFPQAGMADGPGATLVRPVPDPSATFVKFLGVSPREGGGVGSDGGPGFAFGTLGPILGEVGTSTARVLVEVSVPMELHLTVKKSGTNRRGDGPEPAGHWQQLTKVIRNAHRPVVFEVDSLIPDTRYVLDFSPLANASEFRASLRTRALRPFNFRVAAFGGSRDPFGVFPSCADVPKLAAAAGGDEVMAAAEISGRSVAEPANARKVPLLLRERWPYCAVDASEGLRVVGGASPTTLGEPVGGTVVVGTAEDQERCKTPELWGGGVGDVGGGRGHGPNGAGGRGSAGGGWRHPVSTALAIGVATNQAQLAEKERESLLGDGSDDALSISAEFSCTSAWKAMADEVELPAQGLDLVIHMGSEIHAAACLNETEIAELAKTFTEQPQGGVAMHSIQKKAVPSPTEAGTETEAGTGMQMGMMGKMGGGARARRPLLVWPPQLPVDDLTVLGTWDEEDVSQMQEFFIKVHDEAERDRKRGDGEFRHRRIVEPSLAIHTKLPPDDGEQQEEEGQQQQQQGGPELLGGSGGGAGGDGNNVDGIGRGRIGGTGLDGAGVGDMKHRDVQEAWSLVTEEVAERVRDPYRLAWGLPWAKTVMASAPNAFLSFTPLDLDDGFRSLSPHPTDVPSAAATRRNVDISGGGRKGHRLVAHPASITRIREERLRAWVEYQTALSSGNNFGEINKIKSKEETGSSGGGSVGKSKSDKRETDRGGYLEFGGIGVLMLDVWGNQPWRSDEPGGATAKGEEEEGPGFHPKALLSKRQQKLVKKALTSSSANVLLICSGTPMVAEPIVHPKAPPLSDSEQKSRDKTLNHAKKELKKLGKAGLVEIKRMEEEEKVPKLAMLSPEEVGAMGNFYDEARPSFQWSYHSPYLQGLLEKLFDWASEGAMPTKKSQPPRKRDVVLICGGTGCGVRTQVRDRRTGVSFTQLCVGRMSDSTTPCPWPLEAGAIGDRIVFTHTPIVCHRRGGGGESMQKENSAGLASRLTSGNSNTSIGETPNGSRSSSRLGSSRGKSSFGLITVLTEPLDVSVTAGVAQPPGGNAKDLAAEGGAGGKQQLGTKNENEDSQQHQQQKQKQLEESGVAVILGPVVGRVQVVEQSGTVRESCRVPVVLEVDREGDVTCVMRDVATSETFREERTMKPRRPRAFWVQGLRPARRYAIEFEGVLNKEDRTGSLTTPDSSHPDLNIVAVSHDRPGELPSGGEANLWAGLAERLSSPWQGVEAVIHLGGQVDLSNAFEDGKTYLERLEERRKAGRVPEAEEASTMEALKERLREEYRKVWNQPSTKKVLASCQHVMMWGQGECRRGYGRGGHSAVSSWAGRRLLRVAKEVFYEYQRQLWDPLWGCQFKVGDNESFYMTFLRGTVGVLSLDALELCPEWDNRGESGGGAEHAHTKRDISASTTPGSGPESGVTANNVGGGKECSSEEEPPFLGEAQWQRLRTTLEEQKALITLIVVTETPIAWHDIEEYLGEAEGSGGNAAPPPHLEDHWAARPTQQRAILMRLFQWKAESVGKEVVLLAGAGLSEGCVAAETRLEYKLLVQPPPEGGEVRQKGGGDRGTKKTGTRGEQEDEEDEDKKKKPKKATHRLLGLEQITCGPITAEPMVKPTGNIPPSKGKLLVPLTEAEKEQNRLIKMNSYKTSDGSSESASLAGVGGGMLEDQEPVTFMHLKTWGRNYAVLQVIADTDEEGPIGVVDSELATFSSLDKTHPVQELSQPPRWWSQRCIGDKTALLDDDIYLKGREYNATMEARKWLEVNEDFTQAIRKCYEDLHIADCGRPADLRTIRVEKPAVLKRLVETGVRAVYRTLPAEVADELAYVPDQMILDFIFIKACPEFKTSAFDTAEKWEDLCRQTCIQAAYIRVAALWAEEEEEVLLMADARAEEAVRKEEAQLKRQREKEVKDADRDAAEMADLLANDPEAHMRRVVQKRADDADKRKREGKAKNQDDSVVNRKKEALENKKAEDKERLAREVKEKDTREQQELNELADSDPAEYDRRIKAWHKRKIEGRDGTSSSLNAGDDGGGVDQTQNGDLERRKALARERRDARRAAMHARPSIGLPKKTKK